MIEMKENDGYAAMSPSKTPPKPSFTSQPQTETGKLGASPAELSQAVASPHTTPTSATTPNSVPSPQSSNSGVSDSAIPDVKDSEATRPKAGVVRISKEAVYHRMRRVFHPSGSKTKKVSDEMVKQWDKGGKSRRNLEQIFQSCGYDPDWFSENPSQKLDVSNSFEL